MTKNIISMLCFAALLTTLVSCTDDEQAETMPDNKVFMNFVAGTDDVTRTMLIENNAVAWETGDEISMFDPTDNNRFSTSQSGPSVTFTGMANEASSIYYALYPYDEKATISGTTITTTLNANQISRAGSFAKGLNPSVAITGNEQLNFKNACAVVKFTLNSGSNVVKKAVFRGNNGELLAGTIIIDAASNDPSASVQTEGAAPEVTLTGDFTSGSTYYFVVAPGTLSNGLTLTLYDENGNGYMRSGSKETNLTAGHILNLGTINAETFASYSKTDGTYHIFNAAGLEEWAKQSDCLTSNVVIENDIDMSSINWTPVGTDMQNGYSGDFNGNNKIVNGLNIKSEASNIGFFSGLASNAKVHDIKFTNASVEGNTSSSYAGVVAGSSLGVINNCDISEASVSGYCAGAITGNNSVQVNNCDVSDVTVSANYTAGGIAGLSYGKIEYCTVSGNSTITANGQSSRAGGIVGSTSQESGVETSGRLLKCAVDGATISGAWAGGIAGESSFGIVAQCVANRLNITSGTSGGSLRLGGIVGYNTRGDVVASYSAYSTIGDASLQAEAMGGIVGYNYNSSAYVYGCYSTHVAFNGSVSGNESGIGSIAGYTNGHVTSCYAVLPDNTTGITLVGNGALDPDHCVEAGATDYNTLVNDVTDLKAYDNSVWKAQEIWKLTASGLPMIEADYTGEPSN